MTALIIVSGSWGYPTLDRPAPLGDQRPEAMREGGALGVCTGQSLVLREGSKLALCETEPPIAGNPHPEDLRPSGVIGPAIAGRAGGAP